MNHWEPIEIIFVVLAFAVFVLIVAGGYSAIAHPEAGFVRECAKHRPLADCRLDAEEMFK